MPPAPISSCLAATTSTAAPTILTDLSRCSASAAPLGVLGVLGNHDYWAGGDYVAARLAGVGITVLRNRAVRLAAPGGAHFWVAGLDSSARRHDDSTKRSPVCLPLAPRVLLAHEPEAADEVLARGLHVDLQLSGHSHGGQVVLPGLGAPLLPLLGRRYVSGLHCHPAVYTGRGVGGVPPYIRFNCPPEAAVLMLAQPRCAAPPATRMPGRGPALEHAGHPHPSPA